MYYLRRITITVVSVVVLYFAVVALYRHLNPNTRKSAEEREDARWIATSEYWLDRQACRWLSICGLAHYHPDPAAISWGNQKRTGKTQEPLVLDGDDYVKYIDWKDIAGGGNRLRPGDWDGDGRVLKDVPQYVLDHAPLIHLYSKEQFWPSDMAEHLMHTAPYRHHTPMGMNNSQHTVYNLHELNEKESWRNLFMQSKNDVETRPEWLGSAYNKPMPYDDDDGEGKKSETNQHTQFSAEKSPWYEKEPWYDPLGPNKPKKAEPLSSETFRAPEPLHRPSRLEIRSKRRRSPAVKYPSGYSPAPVVLIMVDKGDGIVDAFWFYFYNYNLGTTVLNIRFGNHVGDWEHSLVRFHNGVPKAVFFSAHSGGLAYAYHAVEKGRGPGREGRPVLYSAYGSHAMYATPGKHPYVLPFGLLADVTDKGPLWDPSLNYLAYHFNTSITHDQDARSLSTQEMHDKLQPAASNPLAPMGWFWYLGHWGDKFYELADLRQWRFAGQYHYVNGPLGPRFKNLGRSKVCQSRGSCTILESIAEGRKKSWVGRRKR
ncbi:Uncharacterized protein BP5553_05087 [Venustampulla echinocandica]|uniref:Vacuolar protein sorting-associated protein TDA6 n=1 Tax=Venustampulla echinocandica TaxID=2656787 RepID=A0A370TQ52_9HELO|nr:Uncharacterized protein BP5553_05087 [Venustampulla echinocandica]RDL37654.1 Uncharacterized protein BP5553_05087 [Venustampulla echinocandica]